MARIAYLETKFSAGSLDVIEQANIIIADYEERGFTLTLRQLYYQFVSRGLLPNRQQEYKRLGSIINDARLAGLVDWDAIEDRGRNLQRVNSWDSPAAIVAACASQFQLDLWEGQPEAVEVWVEKEALLGVVAVPCRLWRVPYFACKGYTSQSEMWDAGHNRLRRAYRGRRVTIIHLGDHDPSGIDMTRDITERLSLFACRPVEVVRIALNMDQVEEYTPPPNPAKTTDSRFSGYVTQYGDESWELDALNPDIIANLIEREVENHVDQGQWSAMQRREEQARKALTQISSNFDAVQDYAAGL